ncbi:MAG: hypothetical protein COB46_00025 [Rhodospirillaceae bacterium]|nr:MAG: hypothetical protein COB46_00025 [Rhodospirillaceae bacterium]
MKLFLVLAGFWLCLSLTFSPKVSQADDACDLLVTNDEWMARITEGKSIGTYFTDLDSCLFHNKVLQKQLNDTAVHFIETLPSVDEQELRKNISKFLKRALLLNATHNFAPSQYIYALIHNAPPESMIAKIFEQNYGIYAKWVHLADQHGEPRAIFDTAIRMAAKTPVEGFSQSPQMSYVRVLYLEKNVEEFSQQMPWLTEELVPLKQSLIKMLSQKTANSVEKHVYPKYNFNKFRVLKSSETPVAWKLNGQILPPKCFAYVWVSGDNYESFQERFPIKSLDHLIKNTGLYFGKEIPNFEPIYPWEKNMPVSLAKFISKCTVENSAVAHPFNPSKGHPIKIDGEIVTAYDNKKEGLDYKILHSISVKECQSLAPHVKGVCERAFLLRTGSDFGGYIGASYWYTIYGLFRLPDNRQIIIPLKQPSTSYLLS